MLTDSIHPCWKVNAIFWRKILFGKSTRNYTTCFIKIKVTDCLSGRWPSTSRWRCKAIFHHVREVSMPWSWNVIESVIIDFFNILIFNQKHQRWSFIIIKKIPSVTEFSIPAIHYTISSYFLGVVILDCPGFLRLSSDWMCYKLTLNPLGNPSITQPTPF